MQLVSVGFVPILKAIYKNVNLAVHQTALPPTHAHKTLLRS